MPEQQQTHVVLTPVLAEKADEFAKFLGEVVEPAVEAQRPSLAGRWRALRSEAVEDGVVTWVFLFDGGDIDEDWDLGVLLASQYGEESAQQLLQTWTSCLAPYRQWIAAQGEPEQDRIQLLWTCRPISVGQPTREA